VKAAIAENGGFWPLVPVSHYDGHGLTDEQIVRIMNGSTPHLGATLTETAVLTRPLHGLPATYIQCMLAGAELDDDVAELLTSKHWRLVQMSTGHWPMFSQPRELAQILLHTVEE